MSYTYKTLGREYSLTLEDDGLLHCKDLGLKAEALADLKALVLSSIKQERSLPRIPVILMIQGRSWDAVTEYARGSASGKEDRRGNRWVSYRHQGHFDKEPKQYRQLRDADGLYLDTEQNIEFMEQVIQIGKEIMNLKLIQKTVLAKMQKIGDPDKS